MQFRQLLLYAFLCGTTAASQGFQSVGAYEIQTINGKTYANVSGKLYPATYHETKLPNGRVLNQWWAIDFSSYVPPNVKIRIPPPLTGSGTARGGNTDLGGGTKDGATHASPISVRDAGTKHYITISADVLFEFDRSDLTAKAEKVLRELGPILQKYGTHTTLITGHTDSVGTDEYNQELSEKRAQTVKDWLVTQGMVNGPCSTAGAGEKSPVAPNTYNDGTDFPAGRAKNRRVEIVVDTAE